ncbi:purine-nucleoside phosphorylase [Lujinxingia litoralis]|uniref:Purine nucleoside phosphorylase n=1 Tax=Lujinxingia litoralis TaxID=2211119 RepID=A0A328C5C0_9DELT|nr:purine-nucleoside phosphorylase [Lujinxingia litoralis]RAL22206.1 purine-nucleoside phosphorylase [Lujinxingia litoralis]
MAHPTSDLAGRAQASADFLKARITDAPRIAMILGSGLGAIGDQLDDATAIDYAEIPNFPVSGVEGHKGRLVFGRLEGVPVVVMQGRSHFYEGWSMQEVTFPVRAFHLLGIDHLVVTNSAGGINADYKPGDLMIINDHINFTGQNPLHGPNEDAFGPRFPDMSDPYSAELRQLLHQVAHSRDIAVKEGVYAGVAGPSYETPAEVRMLRTLGGDAVGMSTVPEVIVASHCGMKVAGISCITNYAAGLSDTKLHHDEVKETADRVRETFTGLVRGLVQAIAHTL